MHPDQENMAALLTERELDILRLVMQGKTNKEIAHALSITQRTVEFHVSNLLQKLGVESRIQAAVLATKMNLLDSTGVPNPVDNHSGKEFSPGAKWDGSDSMQQEKNMKPRLKQRTITIVSIAVIAIALIVVAILFPPPALLMLIPIPLTVGGMAAFLKSKYIWARIAGMVVFTVGLLLVCIIPSYLYRIYTTPPF